MRRVLISVQNPPSHESLDDLPTTGKWTEYMAFKLPVAALDVHEAHVSAGNLDVCVKPGLRHYAEAIGTLFNDAPRRTHLKKPRWARIEPGWTGTP
jgi:hypothetical protein